MLIRVDDLHFAYPGGVKALTGLSVTIQSGETLGLVGANGSGKTTLARHLNGLLHPQSGNVWIGDWKTTEHSPAQIAHRAAYVFQNPDEQLFQRRVWDEVAFGPRNLGYSSERVRAAVGQALEQLGLDDVSGLNPRDLGYSGRKRVALASALAMQTPVLIFDEPTAGLDAREHAQLAQVLAALHRQCKTVVMISHDLDFLAENVDRLVLLQQGQIVRDAPVQNFFEQQALPDTAGLFAPQMVRLSEQLRHSRLAVNVEQLLNDRLLHPVNAKRS